MQLGGFQEYSACCPAALCYHGEKYVSFSLYSYVRASPFLTMTRRWQFCLVTLLYKMWSWQLITEIRFEFCWTPKQSIQGFLAWLTLVSLFSLNFYDAKLRLRHHLVGQSSFPALGNPNSGVFTETHSFGTFFSCLSRLLSSQKSHAWVWTTKP